LVSVLVLVLVFDFVSDSIFRLVSVFFSFPFRLVSFLEIVLVLDSHHQDKRAQGALFSLLTSHGQAVPPLDLAYWTSKPPLPLVPSRYKLADAPDSANMFKVPVPSVTKAPDMTQSIMRPAEKKGVQKVRSVVVVVVVAVVRICVCCCSCFVVVVVAAVAAVFVFVVVVVFVIVVVVCYICFNDRQMIDWSND
jgi:hypothetical protein